MVLLNFVTEKKNPADFTFQNSYSIEKQTVAQKSNAEPGGGTPYNGLYGEAPPRKEYPFPARGI